MNYTCRRCGNDIVLPRHLSPAALGDFSTAEVDTSRKWIDGKTIYRKTLVVGALTDKGDKLVSTGISGNYTIVEQSGVAISAVRSFPLPYNHTLSQWSIEVSHDNSSKQMRFRTAESVGVTECWYTLCYIKD